MKSNEAAEKDELAKWQGAVAEEGVEEWEEQQQLSRTLIYFHFNQSERQAENACGVDEGEKGRSWKAGRRGCLGAWLGQRLLNKFCWQAQKNCKA